MTGRRLILSVIFSADKRKTPRKAKPHASAYLSANAPVLSAVSRTSAVQLFGEAVLAHAAMHATI